MQSAKILNSSMQKSALHIVNYALWIMVLNFNQFKANVCIKWNCSDTKTSPK